MKTGFTVIASADRTIKFFVHQPEAGAARTPALVQLASDRQAGAILLLVGTLLYREDFAARNTGLPPKDYDSDAELALAVYRHAGIDGLEKLEGEVSVVVWDRTKGRLFALRDPLGSWPLFWRMAGSQLAVGTDLRGLAELSPSRSFDMDYVADFLMRPNPHAELIGQRTAYEGIRRVLPGTTVELDPVGRFDVRSYWDWRDLLASRENLTLDDASARCAELFQEAVAQRLRRAPAAAHLSGGMDSSSVVCVARNLLQRGGGSQPLHCLSLVYQRPSLAGERAYIDHVLNQGGGLQPHFIEGEAVADFTGFDADLPEHDEPYSGLPGYRMDQALIDAADRAGAATILTGQGSDEILSWSPLDIADLIGSGRFRSALAESRQWSRAQNKGLWSIVRRYGLEPLFPISIREGFRIWLRRGYGSWPRLGWFSIPPWVRPEFARKHGMRQLALENARRLSRKPVSLSMQLNTLENTAGDWSRWNLAGPRGIDISHPFKDLRLIRFASKSAGPFQKNPNERKPLLTRAMQGIVPQEILQRRQKRGFDDIYGYGLAKNLPHLERMVSASSLDELGVLKADRLLASLRQASLGIGDIRAHERLDKTLALVAWYEQALRRRPAGVPRDLNDRALVWPDGAESR